MSAQRQSAPETVVAPNCHRVYARIGLLGNPSDGFFGKTVSLSLANFYAEARVRCTPLCV
jgi:glucuronokinase